MIRGKNSVKDLIESHNHTKIIGIELHLRSNNNPDYITLPRLLDSNLTNLYIYIHIPGTRKHLVKVPGWKKGTFFHPSRCFWRASTNCTAIWGLANSCHDSCCAVDAHATANILGAGRWCKLLGHYCSKLRPFLPFGLHIQMICPLLAARTDGCPSVDRSLNVPEIFQSAPWNDQWLEADQAICVSNRLTIHLIPRYLCGPYWWNV